MVGGRVIEVIVLPEKIWVNCKEPTYKDECAIYVVVNENSLNIKEGDKLWWQGSAAYWTPADMRRVEVAIPRIGFSGVKRPTQLEEK